MVKDSSHLRKRNAKRDFISSKDRSFFLSPFSFPSSILPGKDQERKQSLKRAGVWNSEQISVSPSIWETVEGSQNIALIISFQQSQGIEKIDNLIWFVVIKDRAPQTEEERTMSKLCITWGDTDNHDNVWKCHTHTPLPPLNFGIIQFDLCKYSSVPSRFALHAATFPPWHCAIKECFFKIGITEFFSWTLTEVHHVFLLLQCRICTKARSCCGASSSVRCC